MTWAGKITALVLTYNRKEILSRCLNAVVSQDEPPDEVVVLDNGSTDGTFEYLQTSRLLDDGRVVFYRLPENTGPAGGMDALLRLGVERGSDWLWCMDDDTIAEADALKELKAAYAQNFSHPEELGFLKSLASSADGRPNDLPEIDLRAAAGECPTWTDRLGAGLVKLRWATFNSILIPRSTMLRIGNLDPDFYFAGEDIDFTFRTTEVSPGYLVGRSKVIHLCAVSSFFSALSERDPERISMGMYFYRNNVFFRWHYYSVGRTLLYIGKCIYEAVLALGAKTYPLRRSANIILGVLSGIVFVARRRKAGPRPSASDQWNRPVQLSGIPSPRNSASEQPLARLAPRSPPVAEPLPN